MEMIELKMKDVDVRLPMNQANAKIVIEIINANTNTSSNANTNASSNTDIDTDNNKKLEDTKKYFKSPNNTALFLNWLEDKHISKFNIDEFVNTYPIVTREQAETIIAHQIHLGKLLQLSKEKIKVLKKQIKKVSP